MKFIISLATLLLAASNAFPGQTFLPVEGKKFPQIVKVTSFSCINPKNSRQGSGIAFREGDSTFILTSDHVVFHGNKDKGACHNIQSMQKQANASLFAVNSFLGMAILKVEGGLPQAFSLQQIRQQQESDRPLGFAIISGYPFASTTATTDYNAQVLNAFSERKILPLVEQVIEVKGHSEYGMSGGALLSSEGKFVGMISHQYIRLNLGRASTILSYSENMTNGELIALAIPASTITSWLDSILRGSPQADIRMDVIAQLKRQDSIIFDGIRFTALPCRNSKEIVATANIQKGGEGAGIGGNEEESSDICRIAIQLNRGSDSKDNQWPYASVTPWFYQLKEKLLAGATAQMNGLFYRGSRIDPQSLLNMFAMMPKGAVPLLQIESPFQQTSDVIDRIQGLARGSEAMIKTLRLKVAENDPDLNDFLREIESIFSLIELSQWDTLNKVNLQKTLDSSLWSTAMQADFNSAVSLRGKLMRLKEEVNRIRL